MHSPALSRTSFNQKLVKRDANAMDIHTYWVFNRGTWGIDQPVSNQLVSEVT